MKIAEMFPSKYLAAADLQGREITITIASVIMEPIQDGNTTESKPVMRFQGAQKALVLNKTNGETISAAYGDETDAWAGKRVMLFPTTTQFQGKQVPCLRVRIPGTAQVATATQAATQAATQQPPAVDQPPVDQPPVDQAALDQAALDGDAIPF